jgi:DNA-binding response OmpR family regulator
MIALPPMFAREHMSTNQSLTLAGRRVLVIEDQYLIAIEIVEVLERAGAQVVGPTGTVSKATKLISDDGFDLAVVDVELRDGQAYTLVDALQDANVPLVFLSGYEREQLRREYRELPHIAKPFQHRQLVNVLSDLNR